MIVKARIRMLPTETGGRSGPIKSGYVALVGLDGLLSSALVTLSGSELAYPGEAHEVELRFAAPEHLGDRIRVGVAITLHEGSRVIGEGVVEQVFG